MYSIYQELQRNIAIDSRYFQPQSHICDVDYTSVSHLRMWLMIVSFFTLTFNQIMSFYASFMVFLMDSKQFRPHHYTGDASSKYFSCVCIVHRDRCFRPHPHTSDAPCRYSPCVRIVFRWECLHPYPHACIHILSIFLMCVFRHSLRLLPSPTSVRRYATSAHHSYFLTEVMRRL